MILVREGLSPSELRDIRSALEPEELLVLDSVFDALFEASSPRTENPVSAVLLKSPSPEIGERSLIEAFRRQNPDLRLVLLLDRDDDDQTRGAVAAGFNDAVALPATEDRLRAAADLGARAAVNEIPRAEDRSETAPSGPASEPTALVGVGRSIVEIVLESAWSETEKQRLLFEAVDLPADGESYPEGTHRDILLLRAVMEGQDISRILIESMRTRTGIESLRIITDAEHDAMGSTGSPSAFCIRIGAQHEGLGHLHAENASEEVVSSCANWLRHWLLLNAVHADLRRQAWTDELTGAGNRRSLSRVLGQVIERARVDRRPVTVMYFDIDNFKTYNDRFGHAAGDAVLRETVQLLRSVIRRGDHVFRIGGDEFVVIFAPDQTGNRSPNSAPPESIGQIASRFQRQISNLQLPMIGADAPEPISISAGMVSYPWDGRTPEELLQRADELALESKRSGKNVITFGPDRESHGNEDYPG